MKGKIIDPLNLVQTQEGSVVSREIIRNKSGNISIFAFDKGEGLSEHTSPFEATVQVIEGVVDISIGEEKHQLKTGELMVIPGGSPHALHAVEAFKMILTILR